MRSSTAQPSARPSWARCGRGCHWDGAALTSRGSRVTGPPRRRPFGKCATRPAPVRRANYLLYTTFLAEALLELGRSPEAIACLDEAEQRCRARSRRLGALPLPACARLAGQGRADEAQRLAHEAVERAGPPNGSISAAGRGSTSPQCSAARRDATRRAGGGARAVRAQGQPRDGRAHTHPARRERLACALQVRGADRREPHCACTGADPSP